MEILWLFLSRPIAQVYLLVFAVLVAGFVVAVCKQIPWLWAALLACEAVADVVSLILLRHYNQYPAIRYFGEGICTGFALIAFVMLTVATVVVRLTTRSRYVRVW